MSRPELFAVVPDSRSQAGYRQDNGMSWDPVVCWYVYRSGRAVPMVQEDGKLVDARKFPNFVRVQ